MRFRQNNRPKPTANPDLTPLIDVVFQLLIFFMLSATFVVQSSVQIQMPEAEGAAELEQKDLSVTLAYGEGGPENRGRVYVDNIEVATMEELSRILAEKVREQPDIMVLVRSDARTDTGRLVEVLGIANSVGVSNLGIGAQLPDAEE